MVTLKTHLSYTNQRPVLTGVLAMTFAILLGFGIAYATGYATPFKTFADALDGSVDSGISDVSEVADTSVTDEPITVSSIDASPAIDDTSVTEDIGDASVIDEPTTVSSIDAPITDTSITSAPDDTAVSDEPITISSIDQPTNDTSVTSEPIQTTTDEPTTVSSIDSPPVTDTSVTSAPDDSAITDEPITVSSIDQPTNDTSVTSEPIQTTTDEPVTLASIDSNSNNNSITTDNSDQIVASEPDTILPIDTPANTGVPDEPVTVTAPCCTASPDTTVNQIIPNEPVTVLPIDTPISANIPDESVTVTAPCCTAPPTDVPVIDTPPVVTPPVVIPPTVTTPPPPAPSCTLVANPTAIQVFGSSTLSWTTTNAVSFSIDNHIGSETPVVAGTHSVSPLVTTTYTGTATSASGQTVNCSATVTVTFLPPPPGPACTLVANPTSILKGGTAILTWTSNNAVTFSIDNHLGSETPVGGGSVNVSPTQTTTYTGTATASNGDYVNCTATVIVTTPPPAPACTLVASPTSITQGGSSTLSWTTTNAVTFVIDQAIGAVTPIAAGSTSVSPTNTTTYTGTATSADGTVVNCAATVTVTTPGGGITPACTLTAAPTVISQGGSATLSWGGTDIQSVSIDNGVGSEGPSGFTNVSPTQTTTYTGTFTATNGQSLTCQATITVPPPQVCSSNCGGGGGGGGGGQYISFQSVSGQFITPPAAAYVALSQIPYTGLDLGPVGTVIYWLALILICLGVAYLVVFNLLPFLYRKFQSFGSGVAEVLNQPTNGLAMAGGAAFASSASHAPAAHAPVAMSAPVAAPKSAYSLDQGFKSFAEGNTLTIDDIVKGLAREAAVVAPVALAAAPVATQHVAMSASENHAPIAQQVPAYATVPAHAAPTANAAPVSSDVRDFVAALLNGDRSTVFTTLRQVVREGGDAEMFITQVVCAIDDAYRARLDGTPVHPEIAALTQDCATPFLERLNNALTNAVDSSYSPGISGSKLALTRALAVVEG